MSINNFKMEFKETLASPTTEFFYRLTGWVRVYGANANAQGTDRVYATISVREISESQISCTRPRSNRILCQLFSGHSRFDITMQEIDTALSGTVCERDKEYIVNTLAGIQAQMILLAKFALQHTGGAYTHDF